MLIHIHEFLWGSLAANKTCQATKLWGRLGSPRDTWGVSAGCDRPHATASCEAMETTGTPPATGFGSLSLAPAARSLAERAEKTINPGIDVKYLIDQLA